MGGDRTSNKISSDGVRNGSHRNRTSDGRTSGPTRRSTKGQWTAEEDEILRMAVQRFKGKNWKKIAECFKDRTDVQCLHRWQKVLNPELVKGPWSKEEDEIIIQLVKKYGAKKWSTISQHLPGRIGKQCRERWHNHLNPNINKEAWTQNEELMLIRAHQIYGNKWAELTKFLPGRSDNAIKNHWNSSVKKKLDMYLASGLLSQFEGSPLVSLENQSMASSSSKAQQCSETDSFVRVNMEELSECSQGSAAACVSQLDNNGSMHTGEECRVIEDYYPAFEEANFGLPEDLNEMGDKCPENDLCLDLDALSEEDWHIDPNKLPDISLIDLGEQIPGLPLPSLIGPDILVDSSAPSKSSTSFVDMILGDTPDFIANSEGRMPYSDVNHNEPGTSKIVTPEVGRDGDNVLHYPNAFQIPVTFASESFGLQLDMLESALYESPPFSTHLPPADAAFNFAEKPKQSSCSRQENAEVSVSPKKDDGFMYSKECYSSPCEDEVFEKKESPRIVSANDFVLAQLNETQSSSLEENVITGDKEDSGTLCYEPPRFPSLDIPFFSCDLLQSGSDIQQEYSPFGIRQLMMSSVTPFKLWDSPSRDASPEAVLKSAAKTFSSTPSILRKRHRDLVSPLSEKRDEKKLEVVTSKQNSLSISANDFSRLDMMLDNIADFKGSPMPVSPNIRNVEVSYGEKENVLPPPCMQTGKSSESIVASECNMSAKEIKDGEGFDKRFSNAAKTKKDLARCLVEHDMNDLLFVSPHQFRSKNDIAIVRSPSGVGHQSCRRLDSVSKHIMLCSSENSCVSVICSPRLGTKRDFTSNKIIAATSLQCSNPSGKVESTSICVDTPFKMSLESPSAWKSPWFLNTFIPGPRINTDITIEDIGYFLSPGECSYDAIGLMKQLGEHTAATFADAQEILGDETPETLMKGKCVPVFSGEGKKERRASLSPSNFKGERRALDFSECGSPEKKKPIFTSPSSYLLKECR